MYTFNNLPIFYQLAHTLGARLECEVSGQWQPFSTYVPLLEDAPIRIVGSEMKEKIQTMLAQYYVPIEFDGLDYMLPTKALEAGAITMLHSGQGVFVQTQSDGTLQAYAESDAAQIRQTQSFFLGHSQMSFFGPHFTIES